ncbi:MAG: hypothetical protein MUO52_15645, partial [Desulfobacterales bacterium]|nr:hypothetical protein [Desulfobacterales bacterium]
KEKTPDFWHQSREVTQWTAELFGAASVIHEHPIHKFLMDAWASSLGEGTQDKRFSVSPAIFCDII